MPANDAGGMPAGHATMEQLLGGGAGGGMGVGIAGDATQPGALLGTLNITVIAASAGGTSVANEPSRWNFSIAIHHQKVEMKTDGLGKVTVPNIPLMPPVEAVVFPSCTPGCSSRRWPRNCPSKPPRNPSR